MRSKLLLLFAVFMGAITTLLFYNYMKKYDVETVMNKHMVEVVVAAQPIKENERITVDKLELASLPEKGLHPQVVTAVEDINGLFATSDIEQGETILKHRTGQEKDESLLVSRKVSDGYRAVSIGVNFVQSVSNLIESEDYVDVIFSEQLKTENDTKIMTELILSHVRVLAVGRKMVEPASEEAYVEYSSVTLELNEKDAVTLINASERGNLQLILHSRIDETPASP